MDEQTIEKNKEEFISIVKENIHRNGIDEFMSWLSSTDFFEAPASSRFHLAEAGGLCAHSLNAYKRLLTLAKAEWGENVSAESIAIVGLFHDVCKCCFYKTEMRNVKVNGEWTQKPQYVVDDPLPYGHGEKSVYIINGYMRLTREEALAINWHMGGFDKRVQGGDQSFSGAFYKYPLCVLMHTADILATYLDEKRPE